jgi:signal transduction histidine kinase
MTENKKIRAELIEALGKEKQLGEMKSRFVSMASHEFRTPLSTILSSAYLAEKYTDSSEQSKREKHLKRIVNAVNNLTNILNEFLSLGRIEEGKVILHHTCFNLKETFEYLISDVSGLLKNGQKINYHHDGEELVCLDGSLLNNIILNLLSNAIKFSEEGMIIELSTVINKEQVTISIKDHGLGIPDDEQQHLMQRFYRAKNVSNIQGTGLGLHIVSKYVELMGGNISFQSSENQGTTFIIQLTSKKTQDNENDSTD